MEEQRFCQSCGMPMPGEELLGSNADGSKNEDYCTYCYQNGAFTEDVTMEGMIDISLHHMQEMYADDPSFKAEEALRQMQSFFPLLKRWKA